MLDGSLEHFEVPGYGPIMHLFKAILAILQQDDRYKELLTNRWGQSKETAYLSLYFKLWTDGSLRDTVEQSVAHCEQSITSFMDTFQGFNELLQSHVSDVVKLKELRDQFDSRKEGLVELLQSQRTTSDRGTRVV